MKLEVRAAAGLSLKGKKIIGRPIVYNSRSENLGGFVEIISPGAFGDSVNGDIRALVEHDYKMLIGRTQSNTMRIKEDREGLLVEIDPPNTRTAEELLESIERRDITGMSFGFTVNDQGAEWNFDEDPALRTVTSAVLHEITITSMPAYRATNVQVAMRHLENYKNSSALNSLGYELDLAKYKTEVLGC